MCVERYEEELNANKLADGKLPRLETSGTSDVAPARKRPDGAPDRQVDSPEAIIDISAELNE